MEMPTSYERLPMSALLKVPQQKRSVDMIHRIMDAAIEVLNKEGSIGFSSEAIAENAGITVASVYQYFANKDMVVSAIIERSVIDVEYLNRKLDIGQNRSSPRETLWQAINLVHQISQPYKRAIKEVLKMNPILGDMGVPVFVRRPFLIMCKERLLLNESRYEIIGGDVKLNVIADTLIYTILNRWTEKNSLISDQEYYESLVDMLVSQFRPLDPDTQ